MYIEDKSNEENTFTYASLDSNDQFYNIKGNDFKELIWQVQNYYLELRDTLNLSDDITFGTEIEFEQGNLNDIKKELKILTSDQCRGWELKGDRTIKVGGEIISPILADTKASWQNLKEICEMLQNTNAIAGCNNAGGHIHFGTQIMGDGAIHWINFVKLWAVYEKIIYRFAYGDNLSHRRSISYAKPISDKLINYIKLMHKYCDEPFGHAIDFLYFDRNSAFNVKNIKGGRYDINNTIEIRCPNSSLEPTIWQNNINFFAKLFLYAKSSKYDDDIVDRRLELYDREYINLELYNEIYLDEALELSDMIFENNLDKVYFLRQYLKSFDICENNEPIKSKTFIKK